MKFERLTPKQLKARLRSRKLRGLALDIDDTLSYTDHRYFEIMTDRFNPEKLTPAEIMKKYKHFRSVPYWNSPEAMPFVKMLLGSSDFHEDIPSINDAKRSVPKIHRILPIVAYITGRPATTYKGTKRWLTQHGFPDAPIVFPYSRSQHEKRHVWKAGVLKSLYPAVVGIVDDHPELKSELQKVKYKGTLFLYDSGKNTKYYHPRLKRYKNWTEILKEIGKVKKGDNAFLAVKKKRT